jgi:F-box and WD-40 domain protein 1/11
MDPSTSTASGQLPIDPWTRPPIKTFQFQHPAYPEQVHTDAVYSIQLVGKYLISCGRDRSIRIWDVNSQQLLKAFEDSHKASVLSTWYDESTDTMVSGGTDGALIIWRFCTGEVVKKIEEAHVESVLSVRCDGRYIVSGSKDRSVKLWDLTDYSLKWTAYGHTAAVISVRLSESYVVSGSGDRCIRVWKLETGELVRIIRGHEKGVTGLEVLGDAAGMVSASSDFTVRVWDGADGRELECLRGHRDLVRSVVVKVRDGSSEENGNHNLLGLETIVSGSYDGSVVVWKKGSDGQWGVALRFDVEETLRSLGRYGTADETSGGGRVFSVQLDDRRLICSTQAGTIVGWEFGFPS